jgi:hypothetical protein
MKTLDPVSIDGSTVKRSATARAWIAAGLTLVGLGAGLAVAYAVAGVAGVTLDPATGPGPKTSEKLIVYSIAGLVWIAAPIATLVLAWKPARSGNRSATAAFAVGILLLGVMLTVTITSITG